MNISCFRGFLGKDDEKLIFFLYFLLYACVEGSYSGRRGIEFKIEIHCQKLTFGHQCL